ncbi:uncharacterized protein LOC133799512 [Humulus lupulus]|uniref:uncharacterized protein LOC133799512 n=1 Tax=Humulus lupulus TaxID=3486 RepID=UPI002B411F0D|nr:uncharacterized protein LOC133799512 [Humulus lupulus]XP_062093514.1 uncharacterized protein LOC133799512 [Humulus lupulus]
MSDSDGMSKQAIHSHHSVWMAHWMSTSFKSTNQGCSRLSICYESQADNHDAKPQLNRRETVKSDSKFENGLSEASESERVKIMDGSLIESSDRLRSERLNYQTFPMFSLQQKGENVLAQKNEQPSGTLGGKLRSETDDYSGYPLVSLEGSRRNLAPMLQWVPEAEASSRENPLQLERTADYPKQARITENKSLATTKSIHGDFIGSTSKIIPYGYNFLKTPARSICKQEDINQPHSILESDERATNTVYHSNSVLLVNEKTVGTLFGSSRNFLRQSETVMLPHNPSTSRSKQPTECRTMQDHTGIRLFSRENNIIELSKSKELYGGPSPSRSMPNIEGAMDVMEEPSSKGPKKVSTTHHLLFNETTDFNLTRGGGQLLKETMVSTKLKEKTSPQLFHSDQDNGFPIKTGVKLQLLGNSTWSDGEKDSREFKTSSVNLKNESSAETSTMDLDSFKRNNLSGLISSSSHKYLEWEQQYCKSQAALAPATEIGGKLPKRKLPDINELAVCASSTDTGTSKTQSLDADHLISHAERPTNLKSNVFPVGCQEPDTSSRWVKRLRLSPTSACGIKGSKMEEAFSHEKVNNIFCKIKKCSISSSEPITGRSGGTDQAALNQKEFLWNDESSPLDSVKENRDATLSHPWIRRWCHNEFVSSLKKSKAVMDGKTQCQKGATDKFQKKHFPSLAAMALMGKTMGGFESCQFAKKGSSVVWNS